MVLRRLYRSLVTLVVFLLLCMDISMADTACNKPLGIQNGNIKDYQMSAFKAYNGDVSKYGAKNARLMKTSPPQGYRGDKRAPEDSWLSVSFEKKLVITAIATQGYGDPSVKEWVTKFVLFYFSSGTDFKPISDGHSNMTIFIGNNDSSTVHRQNIPLPVMASQITLLPNSWNNNVGLRMELYGCEPDFYITVLLMLSGRPFTTEFLNKQSYDYELAVEESVTEAQRYWETVPGFFEIIFKGFSPQQTSLLRALTAVELKVYCLESRLTDVLTKMKTFIKESDVFDSNFYRLRYPRTNVHCYPPTINVISDLTQSSRTSSIFRGSSPAFRIEISHNCSMKPTIFTSCRFAVINQKTGHLSSLVPISSPNERQVSLRPNAYRNSHLIYLQCQADTHGFEGNFAQDFRIIRIVKAKLFPRIKGSEYAIKGGNNLVLDGSVSHVQTKDEYLDVIHMKFSWYCQTGNISDVRSRNGSKSSDGINIEARSCFNSSIEEPISRNKTLNIDNIHLIGGEIYVFKLIFQANGLVASVKQKVAVEKYTKLSFVCLSNCLKKVNPQNKQVLRSECIGNACQKLKTYQWTFYFFNNDSKKYQAHGISGNATSSSEDGIVFMINDFTKLIDHQSDEDQKYKIRLVAYLDAYTYISTERHFILNVVPRTKDGKSGCTVSPTVGIAMETYFNISCANWVDVDVPMNYKFMYLSEFGMILLKSDSDPEVKTKLLAGNKKSNFTLDIIITINDAYGVFSTVELQAKVMLPSEEKSNSVINNTESKLSSVLRSGNSQEAVDEAADQSLFVLSLLNAFKKNPQIDTKAKDDILNQMSKVEVTSIAQVSKCGRLVKTATKQKTKLTQKAKNNALTLIESASKAITSNVANKSTNLNLALVELFSESLVEGVSNILHSSLENSTKAAAIMSKNLQEASEEEGVNITRRSTELIKDIANSITSLTTIGDGPRIVRTNSVVIQVEKNTPSSFNNRVLRQQKNVEITLPTSRDLFSNTNSTPNLISCQMLEYPVNPYYWHPSSKAIKSSVADISLQTENHVLKISSLINPISLILKKKETPKHPRSSNSSFFLKPPTNDSNNMRYHTIFIPSSYMIATVNLIPQEGNEIEVFISPMKRPTPSNYSYATKIPDLTSCTSKDIESFEASNCSRDPYTIEVTSNITGGIGLHFIGLRLLHQETNKTDRPVNNLNTSKTVWKRSLPKWFSHPKEYNLGNKQKNTKNRLFPLLNSLRVNRRKISKREVLKQHRRERRSCIKVKDPPPTPSKFVLDVKTYNPETDVTYQFSSSVSACMFWSEAEQQWKKDGCKLGTKSNLTHIHCLCYHMTAFGGDFFVAPNPIDFDKILFEFTRLGESQNYVVLSMVFVIWLMYFVGLVFARKADLHDKQKIVSCHVNPSEELIGKDLKTYRISIQTASWIGSGTTASVGMTIYGDDANNVVSLYFNNTDPEKKLFARGSVNTYFVNLPETLTEMFKITIWHDNSGSKPSWFLQDVIISDEDGPKQWNFLANRWLAVDKEDHCISADFFLTEENELKNFKNRLYTRAAKQFTNAHLWLSLFTKSVHSPFTRCQRLSCCLLFLMATMVTNAMFYQFGTESNDIILIGPLQVSLKGIKTGIQSSLIVLPISVLTVLIFDNVRQKQVVTGENGSILVEEKVNGFVPRPFVLIAWFLCISGATASSVFTIFYSLMWGADIANQWLVSITVSFLQDIFLTQPIKIIVLVSLLALIIKKPINNHDDVITSNNQELKSHEAVQVPTKEEMNEARIFAESRTTSKHFLTELGLYLPLVILVFVVCYGNRDSQRFMLTNSLRNMAPNFDKVAEPKSFWKWVKEEPISALYEFTWYNNQTFKETNGFNSNRKIFLVGMPRLRQLRVKEEPCPDMKLQYLFKRCLPSYSLSGEDDTPYSLPGWKEQPVANFTDTFTTSNLDRLCPRPWRYTDFKRIQTLPFYGTGILYGGGGFVADLGYNKSTANEVVDLLRENTWIDEYTAAVFLEFTVFNPSSALFSSVRYLYERLPSGAINTIMRTDTLTVYTPTNKTMYFFFQLCQFLLMVIILITIAFEIIRIIKQGVGYFKAIWNLVQWIEVISIVTAIAMFYLKEKYVGRLIERLQANPYETSSTDYIILWSDLETFVLSFVIFVVTIKLLRLIRFSKSVYQLHRTIFQSIKMLGSILQLFLVIMIALSSMATNAFGNVSHNFSSFVKSFTKLLHLLAGGKIFQKDTSFSESPLGLIFVIFYTFLNAFLLVNLLLSVIIDSFNASKSSTDPKVLENSKMSDFTKKYICNAFSSQKKKLSKLIPQKLTKGKSYETKNGNDEKYIYQDNDSTGQGSGYVELRKQRLQKMNGRENRLSKLYYNKKGLEKLKFESIPLITEDKVSDDEESSLNRVNHGEKNSWITSRSKEYLNSKRLENVRFDSVPQDMTQKTLLDEKEGDYSHDYDYDDEHLDEVKGSLNEIINILRSITSEEIG